MLAPQHCLPTASHGSQRTQVRTAGALEFNKISMAAR